MTELCQLLGSDYPLLQGSMAYLTKPNLVAAVSQAGAIGILSTAGLTADSLRQAICAVKQKTTKPFGVNLMLQQANLLSLITVILEEKVHLVTTGAGDPSPYVAPLKKAGIIVIPVIGTVHQAKKVASLGVDAIIAEGSEAGGHIGPTSSMVLIPQVVDAVSLPVIGAGGVYDYRSVQAMLALGARGVQAGTIFLASQECQLPKAYQQALLRADDRATVVIKGTSGHPVRSLENQLTHHYQQLKAKDTPKKVLDDLLISAYHQAISQEEPKQAYFLAGQVAGQLKRIDSVSTIINRLFPTNSK